MVSMETPPCGSVGGFGGDPCERFEVILVLDDRYVGLNTVVIV